MQTIKNLLKRLGQLTIKTTQTKVQWKNQLKYLEKSGRTEEFCYHKDVWENHQLELMWNTHKVQEMQ